ncbi:hypothetical protein BC567DRAFT_16460 [Phyllosticta citribraziliensis]
MPDERLLYWEPSRISRTLAPRVAWFMDEERLRTTRGKDLLPELIDSPRTLFIWYQLDELIEASGTRDAWQMHVEKYWNALGPEVRLSWKRRFLRREAEDIPIEHLRQRLYISDAPLNLRPAIAFVDLSREDDELKEEQSPSLNLAGDQSISKQSSPSAKTTTPGQSSRRKDQRPESLSGERRAATPKPMARRVTPAPTQNHRDDTGPVTHGSYSGALQRSHQGAWRSSNQPRPPEPANSAKPRHKSFTAINRSRSRGPSTQPPNVGTSQRNAPSSGPLNSQNDPKVKRSKNGRFRGKTPFPPP